jgi:hypothetical protein
MGEDYVVIGSAREMARISGFEEQCNGIPDPETIYVHLQAREADTFRMSDGGVFLLIELTKLGGGIVPARNSALVVAKPSRPRNIWEAAQALEEKLRQERMPHRVTAIPLKLQNLDEFCTVTEGMIPELKRNGGYAQQTHLYDRELEESIEAVYTAYTAWKNRPNSVVRREALLTVREYLRNYFISSSEVDSELDKALRETDEDEVFAVLRAFKEKS